MLRIYIGFSYIWELTNTDLYDVVRSESNFCRELESLLYKFFGLIQVRMVLTDHYYTSHSLQNHDIVLLHDTIESLIDSSEWLVYK